MTANTPIGIHDLSFATTEFVLPHTELAAHTGVDIGKYHIGIGQRAMSIAAADEDIVTMSATAAAPLVERWGTERIRTVVLSTETSIDQSKAAGVYVHSLLNLPTSTRVVELKQACYSGTAALQFALGLVHRDPSQQVLVIASDVSRYEPDSPGEATQGAAAVAMLVGANPALIRIEPPSGLYTADVMDFWRPNYRSTALVAGQESIDSYLQAMAGVWKDYTEQGGRPLHEFGAFCYHQPFTKMAFKAHRHLFSTAGYDLGENDMSAMLRLTTAYNEVVGNSYAASMYVALASLLDHADDLSEQSIAFASYGSGCVAEFFGGTVVPGYLEHLRTETHRSVVERRQSIDYATYRTLHQRSLPEDGGHHMTPRQTTGPFRFAGLSGHKRLYERS
ncbi:hydroxymethylglutaryl-CoA synthase [Streptomyces reticuliscabiei]|uniref:hydroxymethylglutaryl-CoA synthase n=1 Tax=Streptomyces reticuliscabiei TaxID=146821 RepID=UPI000A3D189E|nr:hydroxymethylglutaryl-CoA synthase [Streptomyces reticuliscabiei]